jgi:hypothetical protein
MKIPANRRVYFDLPRDIPDGAAEFKLIITPFHALDTAPQADSEEWVNPLLGLCEDSSLTVDKFLEMKREEIALEEANDERLWGNR